MTAGSSRALRVGLVGVGATGSGIAHEVICRSGLEIVAAADISPGRAGRMLADVLGGPAPNVMVESGHQAVVSERPDVAVVTTGSYLRDVHPVALDLVRAGINVVTLCEELSFPWLTHQDMARELDLAARSSGVSLLSTGANPGFMMDVLPIILTAPLRCVEHLQIQRVADVSRFGNNAKKHGLGLTPAQFDECVAAGELRGHVGFWESLAQLGHALGLAADEVEVGQVENVLVTARQRAGRWRSLDAGTVAAVRQVAVARLDGRPVIEVAEYMVFPGADDNLPAGDEYRISGGGQSVNVIIPEGFDSYTASVAMVANMITPVFVALAGLLTMSDFRVRDICCKRAGMTA